MEMKDKIIERKIRGKKEVKRIERGKGIQQNMNKQSREKSTITN